MEVVWAAAMAYFAFFCVHYYGSSTIIEPALMLVFGTFFWLSMQRIVVADDAIVLYRRFGWFKRRIPLAQVAGVDAKMIPGRDGAYPTLYVYTTDKRKFRVSLFSNDRHIQVIVDVRARMNRLKTAQKNAAAGAAQPAS